MQGGLGNQLFQYAFGHAVSRYRKATLYLDCSNYQICKFRNFELNRFRVKYREVGSLYWKAQKQLEKLNNMTETLFDEQSSPIFLENVFHQVGSVRYEGYWQSWKYFDAYQDIIRKSFRLRKPLSHLALLNLKPNVEYVGVHVRRGDYLSAQCQKIFKLCTLEYYQEAIKFLRKRLSGHSHFLIFSDDPQWVRDNFCDEDMTIVSDGNTEANTVSELILMSRCQHNIIANSSYSWWAAWLNTNRSKIVFAPKEKFRDRKRDPADAFPNDWILL